MTSDGSNMFNPSDTVTLADIMNKLNSIEASIANVNQTNRATVNGIIQSILSRDAFNILLDPCEILISGLPVVQGADLERAIMAILNACGCSEFYRTIVSKRPWLPNANKRNNQSLYSVVIKLCSNSARDAIISKASALKNVNAASIFGTNSNNRVFLNAIWPKETYTLLRKAQQVMKSYNLPPPIVRNLIVCIRASPKDTLIPIYNENDLNVCTSTFLSNTTENMDLERESLPVHTICAQQAQQTALLVTSASETLPQQNNPSLVTIPSGLSLSYQQPQPQLNTDTAGLSLPEQILQHQVTHTPTSAVSNQMTQSFTTPLVPTTNTSVPTANTSMVFSPYSVIQPTPRASVQDRRVPPLRLQRQNRQFFVTSNPLPLSATPTVPLQTIPDASPAATFAASNSNNFSTNLNSNNNDIA